jgi:hypothetical protein
MEPSNGIITNFTFSGNTYFGLRFDGACQESGTLQPDGSYIGFQTCVNGFAAPTNLYPNADCSLINTNFSWLQWEFVPALFAVTRPTDGTQFPLTELSETSTGPITFEAGPIASGDTVQWTLQLNYATSGGRGSVQDIRSFSTDSATTTHDETYTAIGGMINVQAKENGSNPQSAKPINIYVVGTDIPDADITSRLVSLYGGATPNLMTGIAVRESSYQQFTMSSLFTVSALWPTESYDGGSHIGLMQMPTTQADAWDWTANTADATNFFVSAKLPLATKLMNAIIATHPGLRPLTAAELEHMAVCLYGEGARPKLSQQYYAPIQTAEGGWEWAVNNSGNPKGVAYTNYVFSNLR